MRNRFATGVQSTSGGADMKTPRIGRQILLAAWLVAGCTGGPTPFDKANQAATGDEVTHVHPGRHRSLPLGHRHLGRGRALGDHRSDHDRAVPAGDQLLRLGRVALRHQPHQPQQPCGGRDHHHHRVRRRGLGLTGAARRPRRPDWLHQQRQPAARHLSNRPQSGDPRHRHLHVHGPVGLRHLRRRQAGTRATTASIRAPMCRARSISSRRTARRCATSRCRALAASTRSRPIPTIYTGNSGLAISGDSVWTACDGAVKVYQLDKTTPATSVANFHSGDTRTEDFERNSLDLPQQGRHLEQGGLHQRGVRLRDSARHLQHRRLGPAEAAGHAQRARLLLHGPRHAHRRPRLLPARGSSGLRRRRAPRLLGG